MKKTVQKNNIEFKHLWTILCKDTTLDRDTNLISMINIVEGVTMQAEIVGKENMGIMINLKMVSRIVFKKEKKDREMIFRVSMITPDGKKILPGNEGRSVEIPSNKDNLRLIDNVEAIPFAGFGEYNFVFEIKQGDKFKEVYKTPLKLEEAKIDKQN
jgi:hypothetical protein